MSSTPPRDRPMGISVFTKENKNNKNMNKKEKNKLQDRDAHDSWVDLTSSNSGPHSPIRVTPVPFGGEQDYLRMLQEAQRDASRRSSTKVSPISSALMSLNSTTRNTPSASPKSPPNSPNPELATFEEELRHVYVNRGSNIEPVHNINIGGNPNEDGQEAAVSASDLIWDWSSKPNIPPKDWRSPTTSVLCRSKSSSSGSKWSSLSGAKSTERLTAVDEDDESNKKSVSRRPMFSKGVVYTLIFTNLVSLLIGAGFGMWLSRRGSSACDTIIDIAI